MKTVVEIYERKSGKVIETKEFTTNQGLRGFRMYFSMQADTRKYGYRTITNEEVSA